MQEANTTSSRSEHATTSDDVDVSGVNLSNISDAEFQLVKVFWNQEVLTLGELEKVYTLTDVHRETLMKYARHVGPVLSQRMAYFVR